MAVTAQLTFHPAAIASTNFPARAHAGVNGWVACINGSVCSVNGTNCNRTGSVTCVICINSANADTDST
eukprot:1371250-Rhodomonas_salina.2